MQLSDLGLAPGAESGAPDFTGRRFHGMTPGQIGIPP